MRKSVSGSSLGIAVTSIGIAESVLAKRMLMSRTKSSPNGIFNGHGRCCPAPVASSWCRNHARYTTSMLIHPGLASNSSSCLLSCDSDTRPRQTAFVKSWLNWCMLLVQTLLCDLITHKEVLIDVVDIISSK